MFITVDTQTGRIALAEADDFQAFHVVAMPTDAADETVGQALGNDGAFAGADHVWITVEAVRRMASGAASAEWAASFDAMLGDATSNGWMSEDGVCIRAHIQRD